MGAPVAYAMACSRYMHMYGEERVRQGMADVSIATRKWALKNPKSFVNHPQLGRPRRRRLMRTTMSRAGSRGRSTSWTAAW